MPDRVFVAAGCSFLNATVLGIGLASTMWSIAGVGRATSGPPPREYGGVGIIVLAVMSPLLVCIGALVVWQFVAAVRICQGRRRSMATSAAATWALIAGSLLAMSIVFGVVAGALVLFPLVLNIWALVALGTNDEIDAYFAGRPWVSTPAGAGG